MAIRDKAEQREEYEKFKSEINLVDFILNDNSNYYLNNSLSNNNRFVLSNKEEASKITVTKTNNFWIFKDHKSDYSGTILDYCFNYKKLNFKDTCQYLRGAENLPSYSSPNYNQIEKKETKSNKPLAADYFSFSELDPTYLNERGLSNETLFSHAFKNRVGTKHYLNEKKEKRFSTVFPMYGNLSNQVVGLEKTNAYFKGSFENSNKSIGFWKSNLTKENPTIFIGENPLDLMAHYQINNPNNKDNLLYLGTYGDISLKRIKEMEKYISLRENKINGVTLGYDNDAAGRRFTINTLGNLDLKNTNTEASFFVNLNPSKGENHLAVLTVSAADEKTLEDVKSKLTALGNKLPLTTNNELQFRDFETSKVGDSFEMKVILNNRIKTLEPLENFVKEYRNNDFQIQRALTKDFGQDLENKLGIVRTKKEVGINQDGKPFFKSIWRKTKSPKINKGLDTDLAL